MASKRKARYGTALISVLLAVWAFAAFRPAWGADGSDLRVMVTVIDTSSTLDLALDTHEWFLDSWGSMTGTPVHGTYHGRDCMRTELANWGTIAPLSTNVLFSPEDWSGVSTVKLDVFIEGTGDKRIELVVSNPDFVEQHFSQYVVTPGSWVAASWSVSGVTNQAARLVFSALDMTAGEVIHFSNLRIDRGSGDEPWDTFAEDTSAWTGSEDFVPWKSGPRNEPISHNQTRGGSAGALYIPWDAALGGTDSAKMETGDLLGMSLGGYTKYRAWVRSDRTDAPVFLAFWDGTSFVSTTYQSVSAANVWEQLTWDRPSGVNWPGLVSWMVLVRTVAGGTGAVYVDDIEFGY